MAREYRVVAALADTPVPVAPAVTMRDDDSVLGAPFQMVEYVPGQVVRTGPTWRRSAGRRWSATVWTA